ncbi:MAG: hypothetical protein ACOC6F_04245 [bacterium]
MLMVSKSKLQKVHEAHLEAKMAVDKLRGAMADALTGDPDGLAEFSEMCGDDPVLSEAASASMEESPEVRLNRIVLNHHFVQQLCMCFLDFLEGHGVMPAEAKKCVSCFARHMGDLIPKSKAENMACGFASRVMNGTCGSSYRYKLGLPMDEDYNRPR